MNTKAVMTTSAVAMGLAGIILTFAPQETMGYLNVSGSGQGVLIVQLLGGVYFAFAMVNWTARANLIGGIYGRPIAIGNLTHFMIGALALIKGYAKGSGPIVLGVTLAYGVFAILFAIVFFRHPVKQN